MTGWLKRRVSSLGRGDAGRWCALLLALLVTFVIERRFLGFGLFWDDQSQLFENEVIRSGKSPLLFWTGTADARTWSFFYSLMWVEFRVFGDWLLPYHLVSFLFHAINGLLVFRIADRAGIRYPVLPAAWFWLHPVTLESVCWIMQFSKILTLTLLLLWCLLCLPSRSRPRGRLAVLFLACVTSSQAYAVYFLRMFLLLRPPVSRASAARFLLALLGGFYLLYRLGMGGIDRYETSALFQPVPPAASAPAVPPPAASAPPATVPQGSALAAYYGKVLSLDESGAELAAAWGRKLSLTGQTSAYYAARVLFPRKEKIPVGWASFQEFNAWYVPVGILFVALSLLTLKTELLFLNLGLLTLLPCTGLYFIPYMTISPVADRYLYVPLAFFLLWIAQLVSRFAPKAGWVPLLLALLCVPYALASVSRAEYLNRVFHLPLRTIYLKLDP